MHIVFDHVINTIKENLNNYYEYILDITLRFNEFILFVLLYIVTTTENSFVFITFNSLQLI